MDKTHIFKACIKAVKDDTQHPILDKNRILQTRPRDEFAKQAKDACNKITTLRNVLLENRSAYMKIGMHLKSSAQMTDGQRDLIDRESEKFVNFYTVHLAQLRSDWKKIKRKRQHQQHIEVVLDLLTEYLKNVYDIFLEQKKYRVQHELDSYRLLKLASDKKKIPVRPGGEIVKKPLMSKLSSGSSEEYIPNGSNDDHEQRHYSSANGRDRSSYRGLDSENDEDDDDDDDDDFDGEPTRIRELDRIKRKLETNDEAKVALDEDIQKSQQLVDEEAKELSPEDIQMFEEENVQLFHELQGLSEEVELIEKNVVDIAQLQDIFTEKVSLQKHNIERIANAVIGATENVKDANEQIKQAIQRNAGLRVWSLFFLLVMSFALLFLDWYYD
ncbi:syntaxin-18 [Episyrphus balteatus]|uniref:syntaxin-18 n=1 Tax=Episyrphus balteatus TaxID=286459 RepID=UPI002486A483|nr:syntaxin-18 [Episyrphus balteatus]